MPEQSLHFGLACPLVRGSGGRGKGEQKETEMRDNLVRADNIGQGNWFVKEGGHRAYLVISHSSARFFNFDQAGKVFGVSCNGNVTRVNGGTMVHPADYTDYLRDIRVCQMRNTEGCRARSDCDDLGRMVVRKKGAVLEGVRITIEGNVHIEACS